MARINYLFAGIPTGDFDRALEWYTRLLGRKPDRFPKDREAVWQLAQTSLIYLVNDPDRAGNGLLTVMVDDLEAQIADLERRGISAGAIERMGSGALKMTLIDPEGNSIGFGQVPDS